MDDITKPEVGQIVAPKSSRFNISDASGFVEFKIDQEIARDTLNIIAKFHSCNCWGWGGNFNFEFPLQLAIFQTLTVT